jgi:hypothetical protein
MEPPTGDRGGSNRAAERLRKGLGAYPHAGVALGAALGLLIAAVAVTVLVLVRSSAPAARPAVPSSARATVTSTGGTISDPIDPSNLYDVPFGVTSFWIQPWRAYLDTWPASRLLDAVGINFNVDAAQAPDVARLLHDTGFKLARIEINWSGLSYGDPTTFTDESSLRTRLTALKENGLRPLILLDANSEAPCPAKKLALTTVSPAPAGSSTVTLSAASAAEVVPGKTGFDGITFRSAAGLQGKHGKQKAGAHTRVALTPAQRRARREELRARASAGLTQLVLRGNPGILIIHVSPSGVATLSRPLPIALAAGTHKGSTLLYAPFASPKLSDGSPNSAFQATLHGWLSYVATVSRLAQSIFGPGGYDLEVWNELSFGSQFLNAADYYTQTGGSTEGSSEHEGSSESEGPSEAKTQKSKNTKAIVKALLDETVAYVRDPANGISSEVGISNGFASQTPFASGALAPPGLTALSKHPYATAKLFPAEYHTGPGGIPRDALGQRDTAGPARSPGRFTPLFVPHYQSLLPEYSLTATSTETLIRDLAPFTTTIYKIPHGLHASRPGQRPPQVWVTEYNLSAGHASVMGPDETTPATGPSAQLTPTDKAHLEAKALLRNLVSMVGAGVSREYFYAAANAEALSVIGEPFMSAVASHPDVYPGDQLGGETVTGMHDLLTQFQGPGAGPAGARQLQLLSITQDGNHAQFTGDGTPQHPNLYDRDVLAVFPFQTSPTRYVIPVYVMTRDMLTLYEPNQPNTDIHRFDLPNETFRITLANLPTGNHPPTVTAYDPLLNTDTRARLVSRHGDTATFAIAATDYPRLLTLDYAG